MKITIEFEKHDLWIGLYWRYDEQYRLGHIYICLLPCLPIHITWENEK